jgi:ATP-dependent protease ClpP protease subunit
MITYYKFDVIDNNFYFIGDINDYSINEVQQAFNKLERNANTTSINFYLTSDGGDTYYDGDNLFPMILVSLGLLEYYQREDLVKAINTGIKL